MKQLKFKDEWEILHRLFDCKTDIKWNGKEWVIYLDWSKMVNRNIMICISKGYNSKAEMKYIKEYFDYIDNDKKI